jgi:hypothetical protein
MARACGRAPRCALLAGSRLSGHRVDPALFVGAIFLFSFWRKGWQ